MIREVIRRAIEPRSKRRRGVYVVCTIIPLFFGVLGIGMEGDLKVAIPYIGIVSICAVQFFRPTLLAWSALTALFSAYAIAVAAKFQPPVHEFVLFLLCGTLPALALLFSWPKAIQR